MNSTNKTLYIPLYGKALVSERGLFLSDKKAEEIWKQETFPLKRKSRSKWLAYYMGIRAAVFDTWVREQIATHEHAVVLHLGCGLDSRALRVGEHPLWYDVDFPDVIAERARYFTQDDTYKMLAADVRDDAFLAQIPTHSTAIVVMEGVSMYLAPDALKSLFAALAARFDKVVLLADFYTLFGAKMSKIKNPVNDVGVRTLYGIDDPRTLDVGVLRLEKEHEMTPAQYVNELKGCEKAVFRKLYAGRMARRLYRLYSFRK